MRAAYPSSGLVIAKSFPTSPQAVAVTTEATLFSFTIPAAQVAVGDQFVCEYDLDTINSSGGSLSPVYRLKLGATTVRTFTPATPSNTNRTSIFGTIRLNLAALANQTIDWLHLASGGAIAPAAGNLSTATSASATAPGVTEDMSTDKVLALTVQLSQTTSHDVRFLSAILRRNR